MLSSDKKNLFEQLFSATYDWIPFENVHYSNTRLAEYSFRESDKSSFIKIDINAFMIATAINGGPFALLLNNKIVPTGASDYKDKIIILSSYGNRINAIDLKRTVSAHSDKEIKHWILFEFTKEEDILIISPNGVIFILNPMNGDVVLKIDYQSQFGNSNLIENAKSKENSVIIKTGTNCFYYIHDIYHPEIIEFGQPNFGLADLQTMEESKMTPKGGAKQAMTRSTSLPVRQTIDDYLMIPKSKSRSKKMEILIAHPKEGLLLLDDQKESTYSSDMSNFCSDDVGNIGHITN